MKRFLIAFLLSCVLPAAHVAAQFRGGISRRPCRTVRTRFTHRLVRVGRADDTRGA